MEVADLIIVGSGPAGYTAAVYAARANINVVLFEGFENFPGGQLMTTTTVENFPGFPQGIMGPDLMYNMKKQAQKFSVKIISEDVGEVDVSTYPFTVNGRKTQVQAKSMIIATGAMARRLDIPGAGDNEFWQKGVSACAVCDGAAPIFKDKPLFVVGGGDSALEEAMFLTKYGSKVFIVHRRDSLKASKIMEDRAKKNPKIEFLWDSEVVEVLGEDIVTGLLIKNIKTGKVDKKEASGLFFAIGRIPNTGFLQGKLDLNDGYIVSGLKKEYESSTSVDGIFTAGDVQYNKYKQAIVAAGSGCVAALDVEKWLESKKH